MNTRLSAVKKGKKNPRNNNMKNKISCYYVASNIVANDKLL